MRSVFKSLVVGLVAFSVTVTTIPAQARNDRHRDYREYSRDYDRHGHGDYDRRGYRDYRGDRYYPRGYYAYRGYPRGYHRYYYRDDGDAVIAAGLIGLAIGAVIASDRDRYDRPYRDYDRNYDYYDD